MKEKIELTPEQVDGIKDHEAKRQAIIDMLKEKYDVKPLIKKKRK